LTLETLSQGGDGREGAVRSVAAMNQTPFLVDGQRGGSGNDTPAPRFVTAKHAMVAGGTSLLEGRRQRFKNSKDFDMAFGAVRHPYLESTTSPLKFSAIVVVTSFRCDACRLMTRRATQPLR